MDRPYASGQLCVFPRERAAAMSDNESQNSAALNAARYMGFGFEFAGIIIAGVVIGQYLDRWLGSAPLCTLILTLGAMVGAVRRLLWSLKKHSSRGGQ